MKLGGAELLVIFLLLFFVLGPERTMLYARKAGKWLRILKVYLSSMTEDLKETVIDPLQEMQEPFQQIAKPLGDLTKDMNTSLTDVTKSFDDISREIERPVQKKDDQPSAQEEASAESAQVLEMAEFVDEAN